MKATPAFDLALCERFGVLPLEFDGREDSVFQPYDRAGRRHMEYVRERGVEADVPVADIVATFEREYPRLVAAGESAATTRFRDEAAQTVTREQKMLKSAIECSQRSLMASRPILIGSSRRCPSRW